jgi:two-component system, NarL family, nitrate/nitrite response regulator NarL
MALDPIDVDFHDHVRRPRFRTRTPRVLVVDDDLLIAEAFVFALVQRGFAARFAVPATLANVRDAMTWTPDLALLDVGLVEGDPVTFIEILRDSGVQVAVRGGSGDRDLLVRCASAGASAVAESNMPLDQLVEVLGRLVPTPINPSIDGEAPPPPVRAARRGGPGRLGPFAILTQREQEVLAELMEGRTADVIAKSGGVALSTVRSQIKSILQKLGVNSQLAAVGLARQTGWTHPRSDHARPEPQFDRRIGDDRRVAGDRLSLADDPLAG